MWKTIQNLPGLAPSWVHVWRLRTADFREQAPLLLLRLSDPERQRVARFHFEHHRQAYLVTHAVMHLLLDHYLGMQGGQVVFGYNNCGKPHIDLTQTPTSVRGFQFNISESKGTALLAFGLCTEMGVDVEAWRPDLEIERLANRFFAPGETRRLLAVPPAQRRAAFFYGWTRKEAYMKARGLGFSLPLASFEVSMHPAEPPALLSTIEPGVVVSDWRMFSFEPGEGFAGALALTGPAQLELMDFTPQLL